MNCNKVTAKQVLEQNWKPRSSDPISLQNSVFLSLYHIFQPGGHATVSCEVNSVYHDRNS